MITELILEKKKTILLQRSQDLILFHWNCKKRDILVQEKKCSRSKWVLWEIQMKLTVNVVSDLPCLMQLVQSNKQLFKGLWFYGISVYKCSSNWFSKNTTAKGRMCDRRLRHQLFSGEWRSVRLDLPNQYSTL